MAKISTYPDTPPPTLDDFLLGTDVNNSNATQNFLVSDLATLINPTIYKVYTALLTQSGTGEINTDILEDTFGFGWSFIRVDVGNYQIQDSVNNPFTDNKTVGFITLSNGLTNKIANFTRANFNIAAFSTLDPQSGNRVDLNATAQIEIRVYN